MDLDKRERAWEMARKVQQRLGLIWGINPGDITVDVVPEDQTWEEYWQAKRWKQVFGKARRTTPENVWARRRSAAGVEGSSSSKAGTRSVAAPDATCAPCPRQPGLF